MVGPHNAGRHFPAFAALFTVREVVMPKTLADPGDVTQTSPVTILHDGVTILDQTFEPDDGDDAEPEQV